MSAWQSPAGHVSAKYRCGEPVHEDIKPVLGVAQSGQVRTLPGQIALEALHAPVLAALLTQLDQGIVAACTHHMPQLINAILLIADLTKGCFTQPWVTEEDCPRVM